MFAHIDGDILVYRCGFAAEKMHYFLDTGDVGMEFKTSKEVDEFLGCKRKDRDEVLRSRGFVLCNERIAEPLKNALYNVKSVVSTILDEIPTSQYIVYLSGTTNFRTDIATVRVYKGNRDPKNKPIHGPKIKEYIQRRYDCLVSDGEEADDLMAQKHYSMWQADPDSSVLVTIDKDLMTVPGWHYNFVTKEHVYVDESTATLLFYKQLLTGDQVDNIPGVPGCGPAKAAAALAECSSEQEMFDAARTLYVQSYGEEADAMLLEQARLVYIRRRPGEMWTPPHAQS